MLRSATPADTPNIVAIAIDAGLFLAKEVGPLREALDQFHNGHPSIEQSVKVWIDDATDQLVGAVYYRADPMTDRKWDLWMIAVAPDHQRRGIGTELIRSVETHLHASGGRLLLIETSSLTKFDKSRAFYVKQGYGQVACIPDFYTDGDSKVIYAKRFSPVGFR